MIEKPVLEVTDLAVGYQGGGVGVSGVNIIVDVGKVVTLVGPNGAGKTSTLKGIAGLFRRDQARLLSGRVRVEGKDVTHLGPLRRARIGIAMVPERDKIFTDLTVAENLRLGGIPAGRKSPEHLERALYVFPDLKDHLQRKAGYLSGGQRQMLAVASALCGAPRMLLVDELTLGLSPSLIETMAGSLQGIVESGLPILMAEQNVAIAVRLSTTMYVLDGGRVVKIGSPEALQSDSDVAAAFLGRQ